MAEAHTKKRESQAAKRDAGRWRAVVARDAAADFLFAVKTTGIYCRPCCPARRPKRHNVTFFATPDEARRCGFRACRRCDPDGRGLAAAQADTVAAACREIEAAHDPLTLDELARRVGASQRQLHRLFVAQTGLTPKAYAAGLRQGRVRQALAAKNGVTTALHEAGYGSAGSFYPEAQKALGMTPKSYRAGAAGIRIRFAVGACSLGSVLVAATDRGVCAVLLGEEPQPLVDDLQRRFPRAALVGGDSAFDALAARAIAIVDGRRSAAPLPLDIRGTAFQHRVWQELTRIPAGETATYAQVAARIGKPGGVRAVAAACAANPVAVIVPCHRVVRTGGGLAGYRWGVERKRRLIEREGGG